MDGWMNQQIDEQIDEQIDRQMDGWMEMDGQIDRWIDRQTVIIPKKIDKSECPTSDTNHWRLSLGGAIDVDTLI